MVRGSNLYYVMNETYPSGQPLPSKLVGSLENVVYDGQPSVYRQGPVKNQPVKPQSR